MCKTAPSATQTPERPAPWVTGYPKRLRASQRPGRTKPMTEPAYVAEPDPPIDLSKLPISGDWTPYGQLFTTEPGPPRPRLPMIAPVAVGPLCPRWNFQAPRHPKCNKPLQDYKCPQHGLIREAMPK